MDLKSWLLVLRNYTIYQPLYIFYKIFDWFLLIIIFRERLINTKNQIINENLSLSKPFMILVWFVISSTLTLILGLVEVKWDKYFNFNFLDIFSSKISSISYLHKQSRAREWMERKGELVDEFDKDESFKVVVTYSNFSKKNEWMRNIWE